MADHYRKRGQFDEAITLSLQELNAQPTYVSAHVVLGRSYLDRGDYSNAEVEFHRVVELSPENLRARVHLGQICEAQGRTNEAINHYEAALGFFPLEREILASLDRLRSSIAPADASLPGDKIKDAPELPASGSTETTGEPFATETLADLYASQGLPDRAAVIYEQLLDKKPSREGIRAKLTALRERQELGAAQPDEAGATPGAHPSEAPQPQSVAGPAPVSDLFEERAAATAATPVRMSREQMLLEELTRWLHGVRRYRKMAAVEQPHGAVEAHPSRFAPTRRRWQVSPRQPQKGSSVRRILVLNGPNLNLLGHREPDQYGRRTLKEIEDELRSYAASHEAEIRFVQTNHEGALIDAIHNAIGWADALVVNPAGLTHTSVGLRDAILAADIPAVEVHLSNIYRREEFRHQSLIADVAAGQITGFGPFSYLLGIQAALHLLEDQGT